MVVCAHDEDPPNLFSPTEYYGFLQLLLFRPRYGGTCKDRVQFGVEFAQASQVQLFEAVT